MVLHQHLALRLHKSWRRERELTSSVSESKIVSSKIWRNYWLCSCDYAVCICHSGRLKSYPSSLMHFSNESCCLGRSSPREIWEFPSHGGTPKQLFIFQSASYLSIGFPFLYMWRCRESNSGATRDLKNFYKSYFVFSANADLTEASRERTKPFFRELLQFGRRRSTHLLESHGITPTSCIETSQELTSRTRVNLERKRKQNR